jgi:predicted DNA-binding transcriptional regulator AlpA
MSTKKRLPTAPKFHHIDRRADQLAKEPGDPDDLLSTAQLSVWIGLSMQWIEIGRIRGYGPKFRKLGARMVRYKRSDVIRWLNQRVHARTSEYKTGGRAA